MNIKGWQNYNHTVIPKCYPHEDVDISPISNGMIFKMSPSTLFARYTTDFDCGYETDFWACILDKPLNLSDLKAKRRYEINKANKFFYFGKLSENNIDEMYSVFVESLEGYQAKITPISKAEFKKQWEQQFQLENVLMLGVFERDTNMLCGYAHCIDHGKYIPISSMKTRVSKEKNGVNFALVYGICTYYERNLSRGSYLCDGWRNILHDTQFQDWLEKYFQFRKAFCILHVVYRKPISILIHILYPFRKILRPKRLQALLTMEEWQRNCNKKKEQMVGK